MTFGYIRVSTRDQNTDRQIMELEDQCDEVFIDRKSGASKARPELKRMMDKLRKGDIIKVVRLARFGRSMPDLQKLAQQIREIDAVLISLKEGFTFDGSSMGKMMYNLMGTFAEFERDIIRERTMEGLKAAAAQGRVGGRPKGLSPEAKKKAKEVVKLYRNPEWSIREIAKLLNIATTTVYNYLRHEGVKPGTRYKKRYKKAS